MSTYSKSPFKSLKKLGLGVRFLSKFKSARKFGSKSFSFNPGELRTLKLKSLTQRNVKKNVTDMVKVEILKYKKTPKLKY